jgi:3-oxoacyl-[acyl-carrier protein] reductase
MLTERVRRQLPAAQQHQAAIFSLGWLGPPENVALAALLLTAASASWLTGITLDLAGG